MSTNWYEIRYRWAAEGALRDYRYGFDLIDQAKAVATRLIADGANRVEIREGSIGERGEKYKRMSIRNGARMALEKA